MKWNYRWDYKDGENMLRLRPYRDEDAPIILSWCNKEKDFYKWTAGVMGDYPITEKEFAFVKGLMPFTAIDEDGPMGFFTLRKPYDSDDELRVGFVIVSPDKRGKGYGKEMLILGQKFAFELYGTKKVSLAVFDSNMPAYHCYKAAGFQEVACEEDDTFKILDEEWKRIVMEIDVNEYNS